MPESLSLPGVLEMKAGASLRAIGPYTTYLCLEESSENITGRAASRR
ncbi:MAG: hypothetical protein GDA48_01700 [Hormoscilla sp. GM102CHS1]|nr:hypothetical protein [Hormoscilla sp. GM102CHS1]